MWNDAKSREHSQEWKPHTASFMLGVSIGQVIARMQLDEKSQREENQLVKLP